MTRRSTRRAFAHDLVVLLSAAGLSCFAIKAHPQQTTSPRHIAVLLSSWLLRGAEVQEFRKGLLEAGYVEGRDVVIEWQSFGGDYARIPALVADLVQRKPDVILVN